MSDSLEPGSAPNEVTETTTQGYASRLGGSLIAALIGLILVPAAIVLLYWNEGRAVDAIRALSRGAASVVEVSGETVDPAANGKLVHLSGTLLAMTPAKDPVFGVTGDGLVRLTRTVEMYQWKEESTSSSQQSIGGSRTTETKYSYRKDWSSTPVDSGRFKIVAGHENPPMRERTATFDGNDVKIGAWRVDPSVFDKFARFTPVEVRSAPPAGYQGAGEGFYAGQNTGQPAVGDTRVSFTGVSSQIVSVAAADAAGVLSAYRDQNGYAIALIEPGAVGAATLFHDERQSESTLTWILRGVGFVLVLIGLVCLTRPLTMLFAVVPFLESFVGAGAFLAALTLAVPIALLTIAVAWIVHRPLVGGLLLAGAVASAYLLTRLHPRRASGSATSPLPSPPVSDGEGR